MATYTEIRELFVDGDMLNKIDTAVIIAANDLLGGATPTTEEERWAASALDNPRARAEGLWYALLAENNALDVATILAATDSVIQSKVDSLVPQMVKVYNIENPAPTPAA